MDREEYEKLEKKIKDTDKEIDKKVYALYGLGEDEIGVVEGNG